MNHKKYNWIVPLFLCFWGLTGQAAEQPPLLREGLEFRQVEGTARVNPRTKAWRFAIHKTLRDNQITIPTGTELTILPCSTLDKIMVYAGKEEFIAVRIDAIVTQYKNNNFLFLFDAVPLKTTAGAPTAPDKLSEEKTELPQEEQTDMIQAAADPNEMSVIPAQILQRMKPKQKTDFTRMQETAEEIDITGDSMIVGRTGQFYQRQAAAVFVPDGFGRNISGRSFTLLPCHTLEQTENELRRAFGRRRYRVSGIITTFRGKQFLLLQGASRTYTHGNFTP